MKAKIWNHSEWLPMRNRLSWELRDRFGVFLLESGFQILDVMEHKFEPHGYTVVWLLAESHLAIHTFPEEQTLYLELSSCSLEKQIKFLNLLDAQE